MPDNTMSYFHCIVVYAVVLEFSEKVHCTTLREEIIFPFENGSLLVHMTYLLCPALAEWHETTTKGLAPREVARSNLMKAKSSKPWGH